MDLSHPLLTLAPSIDGAVLEVLARRRESLQVRQVARMSRRGSHEGVRRALARWVADGLVMKGGRRWCRRRRAGRPGPLRR
ncbi:MAG: hypothetical protein U0Q15_05085 [Kineosporiaceae bacterium]